VAMTTCTVAQAKIGLTGMIMYRDSDCQKIGVTSAPCVYRREIKGLKPYEVLIATITLEDGQWKITNWKTEELPGPPPSQ
jgi:hypothetical protein